MPFCYKRSDGHAAAKDGRATAYTGEFTMATRVGFIGLGNMGKPIAVNLAKAGFDLMVYDLRPEPMRELAALGAKCARSAAENVRDATNAIDRRLRVAGSNQDVHAALILSAIHSHFRCLFF